MTNGQMVDGEILLGSFDISYALDYDDAGRAVRRRFNQAGTERAEATHYDQRGQRTTVFQPLDIGSSDFVGALESFRWDPVGRLSERREYFDAGAVHRNGVAIGGWLKHAEVFSYDADGRVLRQDVKGRALDWVAYAAPPPPTPPAPVFTRSGPGAPTIGVAPWEPAGEFVRGFAGGFTLDAGTFVDADAPLTFEKTAGPTWLQYTTQADGSHRFHGTPPADGLSRSPTVTLKATDAQGNWTALTFHIWVEGEEFEPGPTPPGTHPQMMAMAESQSVSASNPQVDDLNVLAFLSAVDYSQYGYDAAGRLRGYEYSYALHEDGSGAKQTDPKGYMHRFVFQYEARESYLEKQVFGRSSEINSNFRASSTASTYDAWGRRTAVRETTPLPSNLGTIPDRIRYFSYDAEGNILRRREGEFKDNAFTQSAAQRQQTQTYAYVGGQQVAAGKQNGELDIVGRLTAYQSSESGSVSITVQAGDTLRSIAQRIYGNSNLWYVLAEANAVTDEQLTAGTTLRVPEVKVTANDATTFKPFNPSEAIGNTAPSLPYITPPPKQQCNVLAMIVMIVVIVAVTFLTYGALTAQTTSLMGTIGAGFVAGAAGSAAGQAVGSAMGVASFSWRQVAVDGAINAATAGFGTAAEAGKLGKILAASTWARAAATAVVGQVAGYAANKAVGNEAHFNWKAIAASAVAAGISAGVGEKLNLNPSTGIPGGSGSFAKDLANGLIGGVVSVHTRRAFGFDDKIDYGMIAADAFGNALGNAAVGGIQRWQANRNGAIHHYLREQWREEDMRRLQAEIAAEDQSRLPNWMGNQGALAGLPSNVDRLDDIVLQGTGALTADERRRLASTTTYHTRHVDPYAIARNGGQVDEYNTVQTFRLPESAPVQIEALPLEAARAVVAGLTATEGRANSLERSKQSAVEYWGGNVPMRMAAKAGYNILQGFNSLYGMGTDLEYGRKVQGTIGYAVQHPGAIVDAAGAGLGKWWDSSLGDKLEGAGTFGIEVLASGGTALLTRSGTGVRTFGAVVDVAEESAALRRLADLNATPEAQSLHARINARGIANNVVPAGSAFEGTLYRAVGEGHDPLLIHPRNVGASHRYTGPGQGGLYFATGRHVVEAELVNNGASLAGTKMWAFPDQSLPGLLDLSSPAVRNNLGVSLNDLTRTGGTQAWRYEVTQPLGAWAQQTGYRGVIAPSAQADGGVNLILFDPWGVK